jgi:hypothetical protein
MNQTLKMVAIKTEITKKHAVWMITPGTNLQEEEQNEI